MAEGGWFALGAAIAAAGPVVTSIVSAWVARAKPDYFDKTAMKVLREVLRSSDSKWHHISALSNTIGLSRDDTRQLLLLIGARGRETGSSEWGLVSKVGYKIDRPNPPND